ncbi:MAG: hypothetical protein HY903_14555 [Deltaproteobacteria bacterium]|nr:hypothetical protein [Deltaproteobacteria bacterium]
MTDGFPIKGKGVAPPGDLGAGTPVPSSVIDPTGTKTVPVGYDAVLSQLRSPSGLVLPRLLVSPADVEVAGPVGAPVGDAKALQRFVTALGVETGKQRLVNRSRQLETLPKVKIGIDVVAANALPRALALQEVAAGLTRVFRQKERGTAGVGAERTLKAIEERFGAVKRALVASDGLGDAVAQVEQLQRHVHEAVQAKGQGQGR